MGPSESDVAEGGGQPAAPVIRILHVVISLDVGGMERVLTRVARELVPRGFDVWVCGIERRGKLADTFVAPDHVVSLEKPAGRSFRAIWRLHQLIRRIRPDVVHTHNLGPLIYGVAATGFGRFRPILHGQHCQLFCPDLPPPRLAIRRFLYRACWRVHTVSRESLSELIRLGFPRERLVPVVNGVDTTAFAPGDRLAARRQLGVPEQGRYAAIVARFEQRKRHGLLIEGVAKLVAQGKDLRLLIAGDGPTRSDLEGLAQSGGVGERVHFLGFRDDVATVCQAADVVVLPSTGEGLSNAILEAMACGTPALCHAACGCAEAIDDGVDGWVRSIDSAESMADALGAVMQSADALQAAGLAARRKVLEHFDFRDTVKGYERLYRDLVAGVR